MKQQSALSNEFQSLGKIEAKKFKLNKFSEKDIPTNIHPFLENAVALNQGEQKPKSNGGRKHKIDIDSYINASRIRSIY